MAATEKRWRFFRAGGFDQVRIEEAEDLLALETLDQKLWMALSCPVMGVHFDVRTLEFVDSDSDGHVRAPELLEAIRWAAGCLADASVLARGHLRLADIRTSDAASAAISEAAHRLARDLGKPEGDSLTVEEVSAAQDRHLARLMAQWESSATLPLGDQTAAAWEALEAVRDKVDDFFMRCDLGRYDDRTLDLLRGGDEIFKSVASAAVLKPDVVAALPLARVRPEDGLPLKSGLNPAWADAVELFRLQVVVPVLGDQNVLDSAGWSGIKGTLAPYGEWLAVRPDTNARNDAVRQLEQLTRYVRDLMDLANNFVAFRDFYTRQGKAVFQAGTLYLDGRSCELCVKVLDPTRHATLATLSRICLVYCDCIRGGRKMTIAAGFTAGDSDQLMVGRNGVFYDREGNDWDATIVKIIEHPISLRQAFWSPYKRLSRLVSSQMEKFAANKAKEGEARLAGTIDTAPKGTVSQAFDVGKFAGVFAAIGLALGAIGTAVATVVTGVLTLKWWQMPLALLAFMLVISGPSVAMAWFKLRARNLGPILDANGWAINTRAAINIPFGTSLTQMARLPENSERSLSDPYAEDRRKGRTVLVPVMLVTVFIVLYLLVRLAMR